jgi:hypothetical protein
VSEATEVAALLDEVAPRLDPLAVAVRAEGDATRFFTPAPAGDWVALSFTDSSGHRVIRIALDP